MTTSSMLNRRIQTHHVRLHRLGVNGDRLFDHLKNRAERERQRRISKK